MSGQDRGDRGFPVEEIDTSRAHPARMYDYFLGGWDNYEVDREAAEQLIRLIPGTRVSARANRAFLRRAVREVVRMGVRQIIDIGTGIPTSPNTHEVAREIDPDVRVVYVDNDPIVATHAGAKLTNTADVGFVLADVREPEAILGHPVVRELIDFGEPVALLLVAVLHFISDEEDPAALIARLNEALPRGSCLVITHGASDVYQDAGKAAEVYKNTSSSLTLRSRDEVAALFRGFELLDPGVVSMPSWRPDGEPPAAGEAAPVGGYGGVGVKKT